MEIRLLPPEFADLEPFQAWILATEHERYAKRLDSSMEEIRALYDAVLARAPDALRYLDAHPLDAMPDDAQRLMQLMFSFITVTGPVEMWGQQKVPDTGAAYIDRISEPATFPV